ncbi:MAG: hypothetical protein R2753_11680 [Chitinophagales bacterium]
MKNVYALLLALLCLVVTENIYGQYSGTGTFSQISATADITDGYYVIVESGGAYAMNNSHNGTYLDRTAVSYSGSDIVNPSGAIVWRIEDNGASKTIYNEASAKYVSYTGSSNNVQVVNSVSGNNQRWNFTVSSSITSGARITVNAVQNLYVIHLIKGNAIYTNGTYTNDTDSEV